MALEISLSRTCLQEKTPERWSLVISEEEAWVSSESERFLIGSTRIALESMSTMTMR